MKVVIIGGVAAGATAATRLRRLSEKAEIIILERGEYISFANCGIPYYIGGEILHKKSLILQTPESFRERYNIDVRIKNEVIEINKEEKFVSVKKLVTGEIYKETYDNLIISTGAEPIKPNIEGMDNSKVFSLRNSSDTFKIKEYIENVKPKKVAIIGGGYIGIEMAENLYKLGLEVTIIEKNNQIISPLDYDIVSEIQNYIKSKGINIILQNGVSKLMEQDNKLVIHLDNGKVEADFVVMAIGVKPETKLAKESKIELNEMGQIVVNENMKTSDDSIYAAGDAVEVKIFGTNEKAFIPLAGPANKQGRIAADNICGIDSKYYGSMGSSIIRIFDMVAATTGMNERTAQKLKLDYEKVFIYSLNHASYYPGPTGMHIKVLFEKITGKILGAQIVGGEGVDKRTDILATVIGLGGTAYDLTRLELCYAPPFSSAKDPVNMVGYVIENILNNKARIFHWNDIDELKNREDIVLLDTRTKLEYNFGHIDGFIHIPLDELRDRLNELDKNKKIYLTCATGMRGYLATRILDQNGFESYNLTGGYRLYSSIVN